MDSGRFQVCRRADGTPIRGTDVLLKELRAFKVRQSRAGNETSGAEGRDHDDLCLSCAIPAFMGGLNFMEMNTTEAGTSTRSLPPREMIAFDEEKKALELERVANEKAEREREAERQRATWECKRRTEEEIGDLPWDNPRWGD